MPSTENKLMDENVVDFIGSPKNQGDLQIKVQEDNEDALNEIEKLEVQLNENAEQQRELIEKMKKQPEMVVGNDITKIAVPINENKKEMRVVRTINNGGIKQRYAKKR